MGMYVEKNSWNKIRDYFQHADHRLAVLPIAASCKEHGFHLPMNTDELQIRWLLDKLVDDCPVLIWPVVNYGYYPAFASYNGSISLSRETFTQLISDIADGIFSHGIEKLVLLNAGISTILPLDELVNSEKYSGKLLQCNIYRGRYFLQAEKALSQQPSGGHADEIETSIMMIVAPHKVNMQNARAGDKEKYPKGPLQALDDSRENYSFSGVMGDPTLASELKGSTLVDAMYKDLKQFFSEALK